MARTGTNYADSVHNYRFYAFMYADLDGKAGYERAITDSASETLRLMADHLIETDDSARGALNAEICMHAALLLRRDGIFDSGATNAASRAYAMWAEREGLYGERD